MARVFIIVLAVLAVLIAGGMAMLGAFPPDPRSAAIEKTIPNDRFQAR